MALWRLPIQAPSRREVRAIITSLWRRVVGHTVQSYERELLARRVAERWGISMRDARAVVDLRGRPRGCRQ